MTVKHISDTLFEVNGKVRCELGKQRRKGRASKTFLASDDVPNRYFVGGFDAAGNVIVADKEFEYVHPTHKVWKFYKMGIRTDVPGKVEAWLIVDEFDGPVEDAIARAEELAKGA